MQNDVRVKEWKQPGSLVRTHVGSDDLGSSDSVTIQYKLLILSNLRRMQKSFRPADMRIFWNNGSNMMSPTPRSTRMIRHHIGNRVDVRTIKMIMNTCFFWVSNYRPLSLMYYEFSPVAPSEALIEQFYSIAGFVWNNRRYNFGVV